MEKSTTDLLKKNGWTVECVSPLEIRHEETGSFASLLAAEIVISYLLAEKAKNHP